MSKTASAKGKLNLKDKLTDDYLDLSMCDLQTVPVKEIVSSSIKNDLNDIF